MIVFMYAVHDTKAGNYSPPFIAPNAMVAARHLAQQTTDESSLICKYPEDYELVQIGRFNLETGEIEASPPTVVATAKQLQDREMARGK